MKDMYEMVFKKITNWPFALFLMLCTIVCAAIFGTILYGLITTPERIADLTFVVVILFIVGMFLIDRVLWQLRGVEILRITNRIEIHKRNKLFKSLSCIELSELDNISFSDDRMIPGWIRTYGFSRGKIVIKYLGRNLRIGQDITLTQAEAAAKEIEEEIERRSV